MQGGLKNPWNRQDAKSAKESKGSVGGYRMGYTQASPSGLLGVLAVN